MPFNPELAKQEHQAFLTRYPLDILPTLLLQEYSNLEREDAFTYFLESRTTHAGSIRGGSSYKFGIYQRADTSATNTVERYRTDGQYAWLAKYGNTRQEAWTTVHQLVVEVAEAAREGNFSIIDKIDLGYVYKWKIAFMYHTEGLVPIFSPRMLAPIARGLSLQLSANPAVSEHLTAIFAKKPAEEELYAYAQHLLETYPPVEEEDDEQPEKQLTPSPARCWLIGTGTGGEQWPTFRDQNLVALGWSATGNLTTFESREVLHEIVTEQYGVEGINPSNTTLALWEFSQHMQAGDYVIAKKGKHEYLGIGTVAGDYKFLDPSTDYAHRRPVNWIKRTGWRDETQNIVTKTLTDIAKYPDYVVDLLQRFGITKASNKKRNYWWLNASPAHWKFTDAVVGETESYTTHNEAGNPRQKQANFKAVKPGDLVIGYESSPVKKIVAELEVVKGIYKDDFEGIERIDFAVRRFLIDPIGWSELPTIAGFENAEVLRNNQGSLFALKESEFRALVGFEVEKRASLPAYDRTQALTEVFLSDEQLRHLELALYRKKNIILQGPPGTGKTYLARRLAYLQMGVKDPARVSMIQFHQSYAYEDFIQGIRPDGHGSFEVRDGFFKKLCDRAANDPEQDYFCIIDEINRGNLSKILGECMLLLEKDKRGAANEISLPFEKNGNQETFFIPENLYLIGTMNTADRSLAAIDYALRRRFAIVSIHPHYGNKLADFLLDADLPEELISKINTRMTALNTKIQDDLSSDFTLGHSYFCDTDRTGQSDQEWYQAVVRYEIAPLLQEYFYDRPEYAIRLANDLLD